MMKPVRDAVVTGAPATLLLEQGVPTATATLLSVLAAAGASFAYRWVRARWTWLFIIDLPTGSK